MMFPVKITAAAALISSAAAQLTVNIPPSLIECQPASLAFSGGQPPYFLSVGPAGQVGAAPYYTFPQAQSGPITWTVNVERGANVSLTLTDGSGTPAYSSGTVIQAGTDTSCVNVTATGQATSGGSSGGGSSASVAPSGGASGTTSGGASQTSPGGASGSSAPASSPTGAASLTKEVGGTVLAVAGLFAAAFGVAL